MNIHSIVGFLIDKGSIDYSAKMYAERYNKKLAMLDKSNVRELGWKPVTDIETTFRWTMESFL